MKTRYTLFILLTLLMMFFACNDDNENLLSIGTEQRAQSLSKLERNRMAIFTMGLDTTFISEWGNYYIVEEDILICKDSLENLPPMTRQYKCNYTATIAQLITVGADNTIDTTTNWREAIREVIKIYNENSGLELVYSEINPDIRITKGYIDGSYVCAAGTFPTYSQRSGNKVVINTHFYKDIDTYLSLSQKVFLMMHEIGHNLGLRHTDAAAEGNANVGLIKIQGTPEEDSASFMNSGTCGNYWVGLSTYDAVALKQLWPKIPMHKVHYVDLNTTERVSDGSYLSRYKIPEKAGKVFAGWYEDAEYTKPVTYRTAIKKDLTLYAKWRPKNNLQNYQVRYNVDFSRTDNISFPEATPVTLSVTIGRGFNNWWDISQYHDESGAVLGSGTITILSVYMEQYILNSSPETYITHTEETLMLDAGTNWLSTKFTSKLGRQYGADGKHGEVTATLSYYAY